MFILGAFEKRVTLYSQQVRALNLIYALVTSGRVKQDAHFAIVGAGAAGVTAAVAAAKAGFTVDLLDQFTKPLAFIGEPYQRWLHPHIYEWPFRHPSLPDPLDPEACLPILNWTGGRGDEVMRRLREDFDGLAHKLSISFQPLVRDVRFRPGADRRYLVCWKAANETYAREADIVILAVGFGTERPWGQVQPISYWRPDQLDTEDPKIGPKRYLVSGNGDGGLIDLLRIKLQYFRHHEIMTKIQRNWGKALDDIESELIRIEERARRLKSEGSEYLQDLNDAYTNLAATLTLPDDVRRRGDTTAVITSKGPYRFNLNTCVLNRFLVSLLPDVPYLQGPSKQRKQGNVHKVTFSDGTFREFDQIIVRHGTVPALLTSFRDIWDECDALRQRGELDQTRFPIYGAFYKSDRLSRTVSAHVSAVQASTCRVNGYKLFYLRNERRLSIRRLALDTGIPETTIRKFEKVALNRGRINRLCFAECKEWMITALEAHFDRPDYLRVGQDDDFNSLLIDYHSTYRKLRVGREPAESAAKTLFPTRAIFFDYDGTLTAREDDTTTWEKIWVALGYRIDDCANYLISYRRGEISHQQWCAITLEKFKERRLSREMLSEMADSVRLIAGVAEMIDELRSEGIKLYIVSGSISFVIKRVLGDLHDRFEVVSSNAMEFDSDGIVSNIIGTDYDFEFKPVFIEKMMRAEGFRPWEVLFVGNSLNDIWAKRSGVTTLCVNPNKTDPAVASHWSHCIWKMDDLRDIRKFVRYERRNDTAP